MLKYLIVLFVCYTASWMFAEESVPTESQQTIHEITGVFSEKGGAPKLLKGHSATLMLADRIYLPILSEEYVKYPYFDSLPPIFTNGKRYILMIAATGEPTEEITRIDGVPSKDPTVFEPVLLRIEEIDISPEDQYLQDAYQNKLNADTESFEPYHQALTTATPETLADVIQSTQKWAVDTPNAALSILAKWGRPDWVKLQADGTLFLNYFIRSDALNTEIRSENQLDTWRKVIRFHITRDLQKILDVTQDKDYQTTTIFKVNPYLDHPVPDYE